MWAALERAAGTDERVHVSVPDGDADAPHLRADIGHCRVLSFSRRPATRPGYVFEVATVLPDGEDALRTVHRYVQRRGSGARR